MQLLLLVQLRLISPVAEVNASPKIKDHSDTHIERPVMCSKGQGRHARSDMPLPKNSNATKAIASLEE